MLGRAGDEVDVAVAHGARSPGPDANSTASRDQRQRVLVVLVDDDEGQVRVLARDQLGRLARPRRRTA